MGYYCRFIPKFVQVACPLHELTSGENVGKKKAAIKWDSRCQQAFDDLKTLCTMAPILAYANFSKPFKLHTDACGTGLGAVLYQTWEDGTEAVIAYASRSLNKAESHYPAHKLEFLALKWAVVKKFHKYLYGSTFNVYTNNNPLTYVLTTAKLDAASHHWVASLANYNFRLHYQAGKTNIDADALSRVSWPECMPDNLGPSLKVTAAAVRAIQEAALEKPVCPIEAYSYDLHVIGAIQDSQQVAQMTLDDWQQVQEVDPILAIIIKRLREGMLEQDWSKKTDSPELSQYRREQNNLVLQKGVLYRWARPRESEGTLLQLVLPTAQREVALRGCHDEVGHLGLEHMLDLMCDRFFWPHMACSGKGAHREVSPMFSFQSQTAKSTSWKYHGHSSSGVGPPWLSMPGTWEGPGRKCSGDHRPFHQVHSGICNKNPISTNDGKDPMGQIYCPLWSTQKDSYWSGMKFWESVGGWPLWVDGGVKDMDQSISSADQWSMWKVQLHSDQYAWDFAQGKEVRVEEPHWNIGSCI